MSSDTSSTLIIKFKKMGQKIWHWNILKANILSEIIIFREKLEVGKTFCLMSFMQLFLRDCPTLRGNIHLTTSTFIDLVWLLLCEAARHPVSRPIWSTLKFLEKFILESPVKGKLENWECLFHEDKSQLEQVTLRQILNKDIPKSL